MGAPGPGDWSHSIKDESRLQRSQCFWGNDPQGVARALPMGWAGMSDAFGVKKRAADMSRRILSCTLALRGTKTSLAAGVGAATATGDPEKPGQTMDSRRTSERQWSHHPQASPSAR